MTELGRFGCAVVLCAVAATAHGDSGDVNWADMDIVILGEVHDNPEHHRVQAELVREIDPTALVFEMFGPERAAEARRIDRQDAEALALALHWPGSGWPDFSLYHPIFLAAPDAQIYGAAVPRDQVRAAVSTGAAAQLDRPDLFPPLPAQEQSDREAAQQAAHCSALPTEMLSGMVEAQRLRDGAFSLTALEALDQSGGPVVVIAGSGHARRDWGMPVYLERLRPGIRVYALGQFEADAPDAPPFDGWRVAAPVERSDPCAAFRASD